MYSAPFIFNYSQSEKTEILKRVPFGSGFNEAWLQQRLFENPQSLPLSEIDPAYQQICPLCTEMTTGSGPIDIVYVTPQGRIVIVETKLWRNPDARRKVVGQILDYAKELSRWTFSDLQREVSRRTGIKGNAPFKLISQRIDAVDEATFVDGVSKSLKRGDFMLLIAGDGIRQDAQGIVQFLQEAGHLRFILSLLEIAVYKHTEKEYFIIQPRILAKTKIIERTLEYSFNPELTEVDEKPDNPINDWRQTYKEFWTRFLDSLTLDDPDQPMANPAANGNAHFTLPPSGSVAWMNAFFDKRTREAGCYLCIANNSTWRWLYQELLEEKEEIEKELSQNIVWIEKSQMVQKSIVIEEGTWPPVNNERVSKFLAETVNSFINTFRHRLEKLSEN